MESIPVHEGDHVFAVHEKIVIEVRVIMQRGLLEDCPRKHPFLTVRDLRLLDAIGVKGEQIGTAVDGDGRFMPGANIGCLIIGQ